MLVDDNATFLRILQRFLEERGSADIRVVATAGGGIEALAKAPSVHPDVVVVDLCMPDMHGLDVIPKLRQLLPNSGIITLTMLGAEGYRKAALAAGANDFVSKGDLEAELLPAIRRVERGGVAGSGPSGHPTETAPNSNSHLDERHRRPSGMAQRGRLHRWGTCGVSANPLVPM
jgi:DNA-binding NarL/FixJ family response regulator